MLWLRKKETYFVFVFLDVPGSNYKGTRILAAKKKVFS
jgi:hypothetical protein